MNVLITGIAGFIGFHAASLCHSKGISVVGIDNFNSYYDPNLKMQRARLLEEKNIHILAIDINDTPSLKSIIEKNKITHILHLAAQAGVRYSLVCPESYLSSNIQGFVSLLECVKNTPHIKIVFASSSSVYGNNASIPFKEEDKTDTPSNLYAATKKAKELLAYSYHHIYQIPMIGLRFFTVYGPWGRPDMAYFHFANSIIHEKPIDIFNYGNMKRDFTYIDDIVEGSVNALFYDKSGYEIFNLGNNNPVSLLSFIEILEGHLGKKAIKNFLPLQKGEIIETFADISKAQTHLQFFPKTNLQEGLAKFSSWYQDYHKSR